MTRSHKEVEQHEDVKQMQGKQGWGEVGEGSRRRRTGRGEGGGAKADQE